ncbi:MAG TPA: ATP-binding protein, partial [Longimicrobiales bacterium]|nr:ATP-binding protein [Longimicrobiales bacterium]
FVATHPSTRPGPHVALSVTDTGAALDEEAQSRIFEPFFSSQELGAGSGLGLATAYGLVKRNGGTIWVTSRPGAGTTFRVYLPREGEARATPS